jgi:hypothetical protein
LLGQPAQLFGNIPVGATGGSFTAVGAFAQQKLSRGHGVFLLVLLVVVSALTTRSGALRSSSGVVVYGAYRTICCSSAWSFAASMGFCSTGA